MRKQSYGIDPGAALLLGFLIFSLRWQELMALVTAMSIHEFGHSICLKLLRVPIRGFSVSLSGPVLHCGAASSRFGQVASALSGPSAGILLWLALRAIWPLCAEFSLFLSLMNLLPILPLDGGRALFAVLQDRTLLLAFGSIAAVAVILAGLYAFKNGYGLGLLLFGLWLMLLACQGSENDVK